MTPQHESERLGDGFTLIEVLAALAILALSTSTVLFVINQNILSAADSVHHMEAFRLARENMERILASSSVGETVEFGTSDHYPDVSWRTMVEAFSEPTGGKMWLRAVCTASFTDSTGQSQTVELTHWLTPLTEQQAEHFLESEEGPSLLADQIISNAEGAARYARVDTTTIEQWLSDGLVVTADGAFIKRNLDIFVRSKGHPSDAARAQQVHSLDELFSALKNAEGQSDVPQAGRPTPAADGSPMRPPLGNQGSPDVGRGARPR